MNKLYELEQQILDCWGICEDLDILFEAVLDKELDVDKVSNILLGMKELYHLKFEKCFNTYEKVLHEKYRSIP